MKIMTHPIDRANWSVIRYDLAATDCPRCHLGRIDPIHGGPCPDCDASGLMPLNDAAHHAIKSYRPIYEPCPRCQGDGIEGAGFQCQDCGGSGRIPFNAAAHEQSRQL